MRFTIAFAAILSAIALAQAPPAEKKPASVVAGIPVNYDEAKVGTYTLPDPLTLANGKPVRDAKTWTEKRRPEIVRLFEENEYGRSPGRPADMTFDVFDKGTPALRRQGHSPTGDHLLLGGQERPEDGSAAVSSGRGAASRCRCCCNISFSANSSAVDDPGVKPGEVWGAIRRRFPRRRAGRSDI